jgi:hypothetical protein
MPSRCIRSSPYPGSASRVEGVTPPRATAARVRDESLREALYAAVKPFA